MHEELYVDQVKRQWEYEAAHPEVSIQSGRDRNGAIIFTATFGGEPLQARELRDILDALEDKELQGVVAQWGRSYLITRIDGGYRAERRDDHARVWCEDAVSLLREIRANYEAGPVNLPK